MNEKRIEKLRKIENKTRRKKRKLRNAVLSIIYL